MSGRWVDVGPGRSVWRPDEPGREMIGPDALLPYLREGSFAGELERLRRGLVELGITECPGDPGPIALLAWPVTTALAVLAEVKSMAGGRRPCVADVERLSRRLWHTSQHNGCPIFIGGRVQDDVNELRAAAGVDGYGWVDSVPDEEVGRCTVHAEDCSGQHTHAQADC